MAGGRGERFWPLSRRDRPKQFLKLTSDKVMLQETVDRVLPLIPIKNIRVVTGESMQPLIEKHMDDLPSDVILTEPTGRNTCAAIGLAATHLLHEDPDAVLVVLSADHLIRPAEKLLAILKEGATIAQDHKHLITIGVVPTRAETGYGYIRQGEPFEHEGENPVFHVSAFAEKPKAVLAKEYYFSGEYLWNSGMFIWSAAAILKAIEEHQPEMSALLKEYARAIGTDAESSARRDLYDRVPDVSVDVGVLERADNVLMVKADLVWDDVGDWNSLARYHDRDDDNNVAIGDAITMETYETTVFNDSDGLVACLGISDIVLVRSGDIVLAAHKTKAQEIKNLLAKLQEDDEKRKYL
jgi:mannose-1-phosphate guanylyltransferase